MGKDIQVEECLESKKKNMLERKESFSYSKNYKNLKCLYIVGQQCADPHMYNLSSSLGHGNVATVLLLLKCHYNTKKPLFAFLTIKNHKKCY